MIPNPRHYLSLGGRLPLYWWSRRIDRPLAKPVNITLSVTNKCYSRCRSCNIWKLYRDEPQLADKELATEEWEEILRRVGRGPVWFTITGGEPTLRADLPSIVEGIVENCRPRYINLATSAIYPKKTESFLRQALESTVKRGVTLTVNVSVDEVDEHYTKVRGVPRGYQKILNTYAQLHELKKEYPNLVLGTNLVLSKFNEERFDLIHKRIKEDLEPDSFVMELGAKRKAIAFDEDISLEDRSYHRVLDYLISGKNQQGKKSRIIRYFRNRYYKLVKQHLELKREVLKCYAGYASCEISCTGEIWNCAVRGESMGNLKHSGYDLWRVWSSPQATEVRRKIKDNHCFCNTANPNYTNMLCNGWII